MRIRWNPWLGAAALALAAGAAWAEERIDNLGTALAAEALEQHRGRETRNTEINWQETNGSVEGNRATGNVNGSNFIRDGAFSNAAGLPITVQNTGNNVLIQNSVILNLDMR